MRNELINIEQIEKYLENKMSQEEKKDFEILMASSQELSERVKNQKELTDRIAINAFKADLALFELEGGNNNGGAKGKGFWYIGVLILGIVAAIGLFFSIWKEKS